MTETEPVVITEPGIHPDLSDADYHRDPVPETSLSVTGAKRLLQSPARFAYDREHPVVKKAFDYGHAAHARILGRGMSVVAYPAEVLAKDGAASTNAAKAFAAEARKRGEVVLKQAEVDTIDAMAAAILDNEAAEWLLRDGVAEESYFWRDPETHIMLRARADWQTHMPTGRPCIVDYKTTAKTADPEEFGWEAGRFGYHMQADHYPEGRRILTGEDPAFVFIAQEKDPPYLVSVCELDEDAREVGAQRNAVARRLYLQCMTRGQWPGYAPRIHRVSIRNARFAPELEETDD